jgi:hypothetical protein
MPAQGPTKLFQQRVVKKKVGNKWVETDIHEIRRGDVFTVQLPDGSMAALDGKTVLRALSDADPRTGAIDAEPADAAGA